MKKFLIIITLFMNIYFLFSFEPHFMYDPAISPDGNKVCFVYLNDLWVVPFEGGTAVRLTNTEADESNPLYSPDGKQIIFNSSRNGINGIYMMPSEGGLSVLVSNENDTVIDWFSDSKNILTVKRISPKLMGYFKKNIFSNKRSELLAEYADSFSSLNKNNSAIYFSILGEPFREAYKGSTNGEIMKLDLLTKKYTKLTNTELTERYPVTSKITANRIFYCYSDGEFFQIYQADNDDFKHAKQLSHFKEWSARDLSIAYNNDRIVYEYFDLLGKFDPQTNTFSTINININEDCLDFLNKKTKLFNNISNYALSPNEKFVVFSSKYDLFAVPTKGGEVKQITFDQKGINNVAILNDNKTVFFSSFVKGEAKLFKTSIDLLEKIEQIEWSKDKNITNLFVSSDNKLNIYYDQDENRDLLAISDTLGVKFDKIPLENNPRAYSFSISPDTKHAFYKYYNPEVWTQNLVYYNPNTKKSDVIYTTNNYFSSFVWSKNSDMMAFMMNGQIYRLDLNPKNDAFFEKDPWSDLTSTKSKTKNEEHQPDFTNIENRFVKITDKEGYSYPLFFTADSTIYYVHVKDEKSTLRKVKFNGGEDTLIYTFRGYLKDITLSNNDKVINYLAKSQLHRFKISDKSDETVNFNTNYEYNTRELNESIFEQAWFGFGHGFYDVNMHGKNWDKLYKKYSAYTKYMYQSKTLGSVMDELIGDVNASHTGFYPRNEESIQYQEYFYPELVFDYSEILKKGIKIKNVFRNSIFAQIYKIQAGDILLKVNGIEITDTTAIETIFVKSNKNYSTYTFLRGKDLIEATVKNTGYSQYRDNSYDDWVESRRLKVEKASKGQIGYLHIQGMNWECLEKFEDELFSKNFNKKAVIIDIRDNGGGNIHDELVEILTKRHYAFTSSRGIFDSKPLPFPGRVFDKPLVLLINENSYSDAEIFPILFKHLKLGKVIGTPTSGSVIGTGQLSFMDGSSMRLPCNGWFTEDMKNMEGMGAKPDILVPLNPEDQILDNDKQLQTAIDELLK